MMVVVNNISVILWNKGHFFFAEKSAGCVLVSAGIQGFLREKERKMLHVGLVNVFDIVDCFFFHQEPQTEDACPHALHGW